MVKFRLLVFILLLKLIGGYAQQSSFLKVIKLGTEINSEAEETYPLLSADGKRLYFSRILHPDNKGGKYSGADIWSSEKKEEEWGKATNDFQKWNDSYNNFIIGKNDSEDTFYLNNGRNPDKGILYSKKIGPIWTNPKNLKIKGLPLKGYSGAFVSDENSVIIISAELPDSYGKEDLYVITQDSTGSWSKPVNLGSTINTSESEISPFLSSDGKTLYFSSNGHKGFGNFDIFSTNKKYDSWTVWERVNNMGAKINSEAFEGYYSQTDQRSAFFSSNRDNDLADIFQVIFLKEIESSLKQNLLATYEDTQKRRGRNYLEKADYISLFGIDKLPSITINQEDSLSQNKILSELIWFMHNQLKTRPELQLRILIESKEDLESKKTLEKTINTINFIARELTDLGVQQSQVYFDGFKSSSEQGMIVHFEAFKLN